MFLLFQQNDFYRAHNIVYCAAKMLQNHRAVQ